MPYQFEEGWVCLTCKQARGADGHDPCLGHLPGVAYACCGHGGNTPTTGYIYFENGVRVGIKVTSISYDDARPSIQVPQRRQPEMTNPQSTLALLTIFTTITQGLAWTAKPYARFGSKLAMSCFCGAVSAVGLVIVLGGKV